MASVGLVRVVDWLGKDGETSDVFCGLDLMKRRAWW